MALVVLRVLCSLTKVVLLASRPPAAATSRLLSSDLYIYTNGIPGTVASSSVVYETTSVVFDLLEMVLVLVAREALCSLVKLALASRYLAATFPPELLLFFRSLCLGLVLFVFLPPLGRAGRLGLERPGWRLRGRALVAVVVLEVLERV
jgi:hypothetical protein